MAKRLFCSDIEGNGLLDSVTQIWCASFQELSPKMQDIGEIFTLTSYEDIEDMFGNPENILVLHNGIAYDKPAIEKVLGFEVKAEVIDTLFLSWYLYPTMIRHGLAVWGEMLGVPKPEVDDWENLTLDVYIHRCQEDVHIQALLWKQIWKHLMLLYGDVSGCWHLIRHLNFKAKCAALQEKSRWKLDVGGAEDLSTLFEGKHLEATSALQKAMPQTVKYSIKTRPKKPFKMDGSLSATGARWESLVLQHVPLDEYYPRKAISYDGEIQVISSYSDPNAGSSIQLKNWLYSLGWEPESFKYVRDKKTNELKTIPQLKNQETEELCASIVRLIEKNSSLSYLSDMSVTKHRLGVVNGLLKNIDEEGYVYAAIQGLTNTLRFKHKICVNLPSLRKPWGKEIRGLLVARSFETELCGSDMCALESRTQLHYMFKYDPDYVAEMSDPSFDAHTDMAVAAKLMTADEEEFYKWYKKNH